MADLADLGLREARDGLRAREFTARELTEACLGAADAAGVLNAFITPPPERALAMADESDRRADAGAALAEYLREIADAAGLATTLTGVAVEAPDVTTLAAEAAEQMTGRFNPRPFDADAAKEIYRCAQ